MTTALILIDIQNDYFLDGKMPLQGMEEAAQNASLILNKFRELGLAIYHIQHISLRPGASFFLPGTFGAEIHSLVTPLANEIIVQKHYPNSFRETSLLDSLQDNYIQELIIMGAMTHMCIDATTRAAFDYQFACSVVSDACATRNLTFDGIEVPMSHVHAGFMHALGSVYAKIIDTKSLVDILEKETA